VPIFCADCNRQRRFVAPSIAPSAGRGMGWKLWRFRPAIDAIRDASKRVLQSGLCHRMCASATAARLGRNPLFGGTRRRGSDHDQFRLRARSWSDGKRKVDLRPSERIMGQSAYRSACVQAGQLFSSVLPSAADLVACLNFGNEDSSDILGTTYYERRR